MDSIATINTTEDANNLATEAKVWRINLRLVNKCLAVLVVSCFIYYLTGTNDLAVKGFAIRDLETQASQLHQENVNLEIKTTTLSSYTELNQRVAELDLVTAEQIKYLSTESQVVAKK